MKKLLAVLTLCIASTSAFAQHHGHHGHHGYRGYGWGWVAPAVIGGAVVYAATRPPVVVQQTPPPVVVYQQPQTLPPAPYGYRYETILDANCNCYRTVLVQ
jgi:hypothetical protein